ELFCNEYASSRYRVDNYWRGQLIHRFNEKGLYHAIPLRKCRNEISSNSVKNMTSLSQPRVTERFAYFIPRRLPRDILRRGKFIRCSDILPTVPPAIDPAEVSQRFGILYVGGTPR